MAPGTNIGAASPINIMGKNEDMKKMSTEDHKTLNDSAAYIRSLAELRGRNADWAELAVRQASSLSAVEAKKMKVIDDVADDYPALLQEINGHRITVLGNIETIKSKGFVIEPFASDWRHDFLSFITNPNIAYILMLIAMYGIFFELANPGAILPGVVGIISLLLVLYAFQLMPINYVGLLLLLTGVGFMIAEIYIGSFGALGIGGVIAFLIGSVMLFDMQNPYYHLDWTMIVMMSIVTMAFFFVVATIALRSHKKAITTGREGLIGRPGVVLNVMNDQIIVRVLGEIWEAKSTATLTPGQTVKVVRVHGLQLEVTPKNKFGE
jgi:membrane-bound serine protease (ClpP class)